MGCPGIGFVFLQLVKTTDILRIADGFEGSHVLAAGKNVRAAQRAVDTRDGSDDKFLFIKLLTAEYRRQRRRELAPDQRDIRNLFNNTNRDRFRVIYFKAFF